MEIKKTTVSLENDHHSDQTNCYKQFSCTIVNEKRTPENVSSKRVSTEFAASLFRRIKSSIKDGCSYYLFKYV